MPCPYCAAFGRDLFGRAPPDAGAIARENPFRRPPRTAEGEPGDGGPWGEEPSWPVGFDQDDRRGAAGARAGPHGPSRGTGPARAPPRAAGTPTADRR